MFMTQQELDDLTGYTKPSAQIRWLQAERIPYKVGGDDRPKVLRSVVIAVLGDAAPQKHEPKLHLTG
jgi:hypothetical protein